MSRAIDGLIAVAVSVALGTAAAPRPARADVVDDEGRELLGAASYKRRLAAALTLSKLHDGRSVRALAIALENDDDPKLRQVAALALAKAMTDATPVADRDVAFAALQRVTVADRDTRVRELSARTLLKLAPLRTPPPPVVVSTSAGPPPVFIYVASATDGSAKAPSDTVAKLTGAVRGMVVRRAPELATQWPGPLPTAKTLGSSGTRAFSVVANIAAVDVVQRGGQAEISCTVQVRVQPWNGVDGVEKWVAHKAASASGQGRASTTATARAVASGIRDCVTAVAEEVTSKQVVPFLRKVVAES